MSETNEAGTTAAAEETALNNEQVENNSAANHEELESNAIGNDENENLTDEEKAEKAAAETEKKSKASERTLRRRQQRRAARAKGDTEALIKAREEAAYFRGLAEAKGAGQSDQAVDDGKPKREDFEDYDDFVDARVEWKMEQRQKQAGAETGTDGQRKAADTKGNQQQPTLDEDTQKVLANFNDTGFEKFGDDFEDMLEAANNGEFAMTPVMFESVVDSELGADVTMFLYDNPDESARIANLTPVRQMRAIQGIEASIKDGSTPVVGGSSTSAEPRQKTISNAPAPVNPVGGDQVPATDLSKLSTEDYIAKRQKEQAKRRR